MARRPVRVDPARHVEWRTAEVPDARVHEGDAVRMPHQEGMDMPRPTGGVVVRECPRVPVPLGVPIHVDAGYLVAERRRCPPVAGGGSQTTKGEWLVRHPASLSGTQDSMSPGSSMSTRVRRPGSRAVQEGSSTTTVLTAERRSRSLLRPLPRRIAAASAAGSVLHDAGKRPCVPAIGEDDRDSGGLPGGSQHLSEHGGLDVRHVAARHDRPRRIGDLDPRSQPAERALVGGRVTCEGD